MVSTRDQNTSVFQMSAISKSGGQQGAQVMLTPEEVDGDKIKKEDEAAWVRTHVQKSETDLDTGSALVERGGWVKLKPEKQRG